MSSKLKITKKIKKELWDLHFTSNESKCKCCSINVITKNKYVVGHIYPEVCGGKLVLYNLLPLCKDCNSKIGQTYLLSYMLNNNLEILLDDNYNNYQNKIKNLDCFNVKFNTKSNYLYNKLDKIIVELINKNYINDKWTNEDFKDTVNKNKDLIIKDIIIDNIIIKEIYIRYNLLNGSLKEIACKVIENENELMRGLCYSMFIYYQNYNKYYKLKNFNLFIDLYNCTIC